jgi:DHA1 family multidrug resistance protein-like MFS transporter
LLLAWRFLPESLPTQIQTKSEKGAGLLDLRSWVQAMRSPLGVLFSLTFISTCGLMIFANVFGLYALERFDFGPEDVGVMMMVLGLVSTVAQGGLAGPLTKRWGDETIIKGGLLATAVGYGFMLLANSYLTILLATAFFGLAIALQVPALSALTSKRATIPQGIAMGLSNSFVSLGRIFGPLLGGYIFDINILLPYMGGSVIMGIGFVLSVVTLKGAKGESSYLFSGESRNLNR